MTLTPLKAIRGRCLWCCLGSRDEVRLCPSTKCNLWPFRLGHGTRGKGLSPTGAIVRYCLGCAGGADIQGRVRGSTAAVTACDGKVRADGWHDGSPCSLWGLRTVQVRRQGRGNRQMALESNQRPPRGQFAGEPCSANQGGGVEGEAFQAPLNKLLVQGCGHGA